MRVSSRRMRRISRYIAISVARSSFGSVSGSLPPSSDSTRKSPSVGSSSRASVRDRIGADRLTQPASATQELQRLGHGFGLGALGVTAHRLDSRTGFAQAGAPGSG